MSVILRAACPQTPCKDGIHPHLYRCGPLPYFDRRPPPPQTPVVCGGREEPTSRGGDLKRFDTQPHPFYWGLDCHARPMSRCLLTRDGERLGPRPLPAGPAPLRKARAPERQEGGIWV